MTKRKLTDAYVAQLLGLPVAQARGVKDLIALKRVTVQLRRAIKDHNNGVTNET